MRAVGGGRSTPRPWSSPGTPTTSAPRAENRRVTGTYPGFSIATVSPGSSSTRATRSMACWAPQVTTTVSSVAATDRDRLPGPEQHPGTQVDGLLGAAGDHDRVLGGRNRPRPAHPSGDGPPQP